MFVPQSLFTIGAFFQGAPGTGKTYSLFSMFPQGRYSSVCIDPKADHESSELFQELRNAAEQSDVSEDNPNQD